MVLNETINATIQNITVQNPIPGINSPITPVLNDVAVNFLNFITNDLAPRMVEVITAPFTEPNVMWIVTPLLIAMVLMQLYFGRHREEELGWNTAFGNSIVLIFVSINLLQFLYNKHGLSIINLITPPTYKIWLVIGLGAMSITQLIINYFHAISKKVAFFINSSISTNLISYLAIIFVYTLIPLDIATLIVSGILLVILVGIFRLIRRLTPMTQTAEQYVQVQKKNELRKKLWLEKMELRQARAADAAYKDAFIAFIAVILLVTGLIFFEILVINDYSAAFWLMPLIQGTVLITASIIYLKKRNLNINNLNYDGELKEWITGLAFGLVILIIYGTINLILSSLTTVTLDYSFDYTTLSIILVIASNALILPLGCELLFRGVILRSLRARMTKHKAIITQALMFTVISINMSLINNPLLFLSLIPTFIIGLILGYLRSKWGLESAISAHVMMNAVGIILWLLK